MPTYQYACTACSEQFEVVQKFTDDPLTDCPTCEGSLRKVFSAVGIVFKGSGFYRTDSRSSTGSSSSTPKSDSAKSDSSSSETKSDSTPEKTTKTTDSSSSSSKPAVAASPS